MSEHLPSRPSVGPRVDHLVVSVRDLEVSHRFYTDVLGFEMCGEMKHSLKMRFYRGSPTSHHDLALAETGYQDHPALPQWNILDMPPGINHIAISYPDRGSWLHQLEHLRASGVEVHMRGNHGMTHSAYVTDPDGNGIEVLYTLPEEVWIEDVDGALNYFEYLPNDDLTDNTDYRRFGADQETAG